MMSGKHHTLFFLVGLTCGFFLQSDAASLLDVNLKIDVNGKTVIDQSLPTSKLFRFLLMVLYSASHCHFLSKITNQLAFNASYIGKMLISLKNI